MSDTITDSSYLTMEQCKRVWAIGKILICPSSGILQTCISWQIATTQYHEKKLFLSNMRIFMVVNSKAANQPKFFVLYEMYTINESISSGFVIPCNVGIYMYAGQFVWHHVTQQCNAGTNRADSRFAPSQWETVLLSNDVSHWLGANIDSALIRLGNT